MKSKPSILPLAAPGFERKLVIGFATAIILVATISLFSYYYNNQRINTSRLVNHTNEVLSEAEQTLSFIKDLESGSRGYVITGDSNYLEHFTLAKDIVFSHVNRLKELTKDNPVQQARIDSLLPIIDKRIDFSLQSVALRNREGVEAAAKLVATRQGKLYMDQIRDLVAKIQDEERSLLAYRQKENNDNIHAFNTAFLIFLAAVLLLLVILFLAIRQNIRIRREAEKKVRENQQELEQKVLERTEELNRNEKKYRYLFENNPMPMWVIDLETFKFLDVNEMAVFQYGYSRREFLSMTALDIRLEEDKDLFKKADHSFYSNEANYNRGIWNHVKKDGTIIQVEIIAHEIVFEGRPARLILSNDVTQKKKAEEKLVASEKQFRNTLDNMLEGAQIIGFDWRYKYVNDTFARHAKYAKEELLGYTVMEKYPGIEQAGIFKIYQRCFDERVSIHLENEFTFPDGSQGWFELNFQPVPAGIFILSMDITERKTAELEVIKLNEELEQKVIDRTAQLVAVNKELEAFSYSVSHDLRAPLRGIIGFASILEEDYGLKLDNEARRVISVIKSNTSKMGQLIDDLLNFSRMGRHEISRARINTDQMVREIIRETDKKSDGVIKWVVHSLADVNGDIAMINQVWTNLISNAVKYSRNSVPPCIEIGSSADGEQTIFFIKDNGVGFDARYSDKLFKVFQRLHSSADFEGTGVGLAIVEKIVSKHGGRVWVEAALNKGACFYFSLSNAQAGLPNM